MVRGDVFRRTARWLSSHPGAQLVVGAVVVAIAFPATPAGSCALVILAGAAGIGIAKLWPRALHRLAAAPQGTSRDLRLAWRRVASCAVFAVIIGAGLSIFWETLTQSPDWQMGDWGAQHAVLARIMPSLPGLDVPTWNHAVSTGDAPLELYPAFTYLLTGHVAIALGLEHDLPLAFMIVAVVVHLALALLTTALAMRVASRKVALTIGMFWLLDSGAVSHGGTVGLFHWAILHSAVAQLFSLIAMLGVMSALRRPRVGASVTIWVATALAAAAHPSALLVVAASALALVGVALLATDVPPRRAFAALLHLAIGVALGAIVWLPAAERLLAYGQTFANELYTTAQLLQTVMTFAMPITAYSLFVYAGYIGMIAGIFSRRAEVILISIVAFALLLGLCDLPYLGLGLVPGPETARLGATRMMMLARPFIFVAGAYLLSLVGAQLRRGWRAAPERQRFVAAALLGIAGGIALRTLPTYWRAEAERAYAESRVVAPDPEGRAQLLTWARARASELRPDAWARALFEEDTHEQMHITALTGLPTLHLGGPLPDLMLRERIADASPESLRRFNVRWVIGVGKSPKLGDPATEQVVGTFHIREVAGWDGAFARIERVGTTDTASSPHDPPRLIVRRLDDRAVEVELVGTTQPAFVVLGTGYYPRWRARHESGKAEPVYATLAYAARGADGVLRRTSNIDAKTGVASRGSNDLEVDPRGLADAGAHVVGAWILPGRTTFTVDGPLPSDGDGRVIALIAALFATAVVVVWSRPRWRARALRPLACGLRRIRRSRATIGRVVVPIIVIGLVARGCLAAHRPARAFLVGSGVRGTAVVEARSGNGRWQTCDYVRIRGDYDCEGLVTVTDATANLIVDAPPSWPFITPAVVASAYGPGVEVRIRRELRLAGRYRAAASHAVHLDVGAGSASLEPQDAITFDVGVASASLEPQRAIAIDVADEDNVIVWQGAVPFPEALSMTLVAADSLEPARPFLAAPPAMPPFSHP